MGSLLSGQKIQVVLNGMMFYNIILTLMFAGVIPSIIASFLQIPICLYLLKFVNLSGSLGKLSIINKLLFTILCIWIFIIVLRFDFSIENSLRVLVRNQALLSYMLILIVPQFAKAQNIDFILHYLYKLNKLYLIMLVPLIPLAISLFRNGEIVEGQTIFEAVHTYVGGGLLFLIIFSYKFEKVKIIHLTALLNFILAAYFGRRGILLLYIATYIIWLIVQMTRQKLSKRLYILFIFSVIILALVWVTLKYGEELFPFLFGRLTDDTRSFTEEELLYDLERSHDTTFGRGIMGGYMSIIETNSLAQMRSGIETGYLDMMLHGGIVFVILYAVFAIIGIIKGLFNKFIYVKYLALYCILLSAYFQTASSNMSFSIRYFLFIFALFVCYDKNIKNQLEN